MGIADRLGPPEWLALDGDERIWVRARPSKNLLLATFVVGTVLLVGLGVVAATFAIDVETGRAVSFAVLLFVFLLTGGVYLVTRRREYVLTDRRACEAVGLFSKRVSAVDLEDVRDVFVEQSGWQAMLNIGTVRLVTDEETLRFVLIENPRQVHQRLLESIDRATD